MATMETDCDQDFSRRKRRQDVSLLVSNQDVCFKFGSKTVAILQKCFVLQCGLPSRNCF